MVAIGTVRIKHAGVNRGPDGGSMRRDDAKRARHRRITVAEAPGASEQ
jgi:hypothetical protein